jgi:hypothetical protein
MKCIADSGRFNPNAIVDMVIKRIYFTDGMDAAVKDIVIAVYKTANVDVTLKNINDVCDHY